MSIGTKLRLREAAPGDLPRVLALLHRAELPVDGVAETFDHFVVAEDDGEIVGAAGIERHGPDGLLRSVVVDPAQRSLRIGALLVERLLHHAEAAGVGDVYLLTTTAERYFPRFGFRPVPREAVASEIRRSNEFRSTCPASAVVMIRHGVQPLTQPATEMAP